MAKSAKAQNTKRFKKDCLELVHCTKYKKLYLYKPLLYSLQLCHKKKSFNFSFIFMPSCQYVKNTASLRVRIFITLQLYGTFSLFSNLRQKLVGSTILVQFQQSNIHLLLRSFKQNLVNKSLALQIVIVKVKSTLSVSRVLCNI